jgi:hypothetical protein
LGRSARMVVNRGQRGKRREKERDLCFNFYYNFRSSFLPASGNYKIRGGKREWRGRHAMASAVAISIRSGWPDQHCSSPH